LPREKSCSVRRNFGENAQSLPLRTGAAILAGFAMRLEREGRGSRKPERRENPKKKKNAINGSRLGVFARR
jgi:hypothetical protein